MMQQTHTLIIGAGPSGLAVAASLQKQKLDYLIVEKEAQAATSWRNHYERLHLHTNKSLSSLPYKKFNKEIPRYPSRQQVVDYLEQYQESFNINPVFDTEATSIKKENGYWITETSNNTFKSKYLIIATGIFSKPKPIQFKGMETFPGKIIHSYAYKTGKDFKAQKVLIVGFGNSACEIAIDLYEQGAAPAMSVRSAVNMIPRDLLGIPILRISLLMSKLPPRMADTINAPLIQLLFGDISKLGLKKKPYGIFEQIQKERTIPLLDIGTMKYIRKRHIKIFDGINYINGNTVHFINGKKENFDTIVAAIGYNNNCAKIIYVDESRFKDLEQPVDKQIFFGKDDLYFCGFWVSPTGMLREIALDAKKIARDIAKKEKAFLHTSITKS